MKIASIFVLALLICTPALAGDFATLNFIGFSKDGKYLAFEEYGTQDGSGFPYANIYLVDVVNNKFAATPVKVRLDRETATEAQARARAKIQAAPSVRRFRIQERNTGNLVVSRLLTDLTGYGGRGESELKTQTINFAEIIGSMYRRGDFDLTLRLTDTTSKDCSYLDDNPPRLLELRLKDNDTDKTVVLQKDASLPASRACPINYRIQHVYLYEDHIAVFLNTYHMGFEGPDLRYMVVTGKYK